MTRELLATARARYRLLLLVGDVLAGFAAVAVGILVEWGVGGSVHGFLVGWWQYILLVTAWLFALGFYNHYDVHPRLVESGGVIRGVLAAVIGALLCSALIYMINRGFGASRAVFGGATISASVLFALVRSLVYRSTPDWMRQERCVALGSGERSLALLDSLSANSRYPHYSALVGLLVPPGSQATSLAPSASPFPVVGSYEVLADIAQSQGLTHVAICPDAPRDAALAHVTSQAEALGLQVERLETMYERLTSRSPVLIAGADWGQSLESVRRHPYIVRYKRTVDVAVVLLAMPATLLIIGGCALLVKLLSPGPAFYSQKRVGKDGREFRFTKLRTMVVDAEKETGAVWATEGDPRVTPIGGVLRKLRLDELPQLFSVLSGDMSIVGPRPERPEFVVRFVEEIPFYEKRLLVSPGITGWAQINHHYDRSLDDVVEKLRYDLYYVSHVSLSFDLQIICRTLWVMLSRKGAQ